LIVEDRGVPESLSVLASREELAALVGVLAAKVEALAGRAAGGVRLVRGRSGRG
jgi:hypothetical protein